MPKNSNPEKKLYDRLHEAVQLDYVNFGPEILSDPTKLADVVNKRWREIFQKERCMPLPDNTIERVYPSVYFVDDAVQTEVITNLDPMCANTCWELVLCTIKHKFPPINSEPRRES